MTESITKIRISDQEYYEKLISCSKTVMTTIIGTVSVVSVSVPLLLWKIKYKYLTPEVKLVSGILLSLPITYYAAAYKRKMILEHIENNYIY